MAGWERYVRKVVPYVPGEQPKNEHVIKLNTNENPYPPAPGVERAMKALEADSMRLYPDPTASDLVEVLAEHYGLAPEQVFVGVGSDDVLAMAFLTFFNSDKPILFPDITYSFYKVWADLFRVPYECPPVDEAFCIRPEDYYKENGGVIFPNPNAPTSVLMPLAQVEDILLHNPDVVVIVDEAYIDFGGTSARPLLDKYENLLVVQTFSKSRSMAGMRIGYAMGHPALIKAMNDVKYSYNSYTMNRTSLAMGVEAVKDDAYFKTCVEKIMNTRSRVSARLRELGFSFAEPATNFIFATHERVPAKELFEALREHDIYVRYFKSPRIDNYLRISVGTDEEMDEFLAFLEDYLKKH